jgi:hypothetical protein
MAYVLSLQPHSPLKRSFSDNPYLQTCSPLKEPLLGPLSDIIARNTSACPLYSLGSNRLGSWAHGNENVSPLASQSLLSLAPENGSGTLSVRTIDHGPRKQTTRGDRPLPFLSRVTAPSNPHSRKSRETYHVPDLSMSSDSPDEPMNTDDSHLDKSELFDLYDAIRVPLPEGQSSDNTSSESRVEEDELALPVGAHSPQPFRRWLSTLRRRHLQRRDDRASEALRLSLDIENRARNALLHPPQAQVSPRRHSESVSSSMGGVFTMESASMTNASTSVAPHSEIGVQGRGRIGNRSSHYSDVRRSLDSHPGPLGPIVDESAWLRSLQRRKIVEELIASEEGYIADLKVLINASRCPHRTYSTLTVYLRTTS